MRAVHELKVWPPYFQSIWDGIKTFEVRKDDRGFKAGDILHLLEWKAAEGDGYTGREITALVTYLLPGGRFGIQDGYVVMGLRKIQSSTSGRLGTP